MELPPLVPPPALPSARAAERAAASAHAERGDRQEELVEQTGERPRVRAASTADCEREARAEGACLGTAIPGKPGVEREAALGELPVENLLESAPRRRSWAANAVDDDAQPLRQDAER